MKKWAKNYEELILKSTEYSGSREPNARVLLASSIKKEKTRFVWCKHNRFYFPVRN